MNSVYCSGIWLVVGATSASNPLWVHDTQSQKTRGGSGAKNCNQVSSRQFVILIIRWKDLY